MKEKKQWKETHGENFVPWVSFFLLAGLAKHTPGEVAETSHSYLEVLVKAAGKACVKDSVHDKNRIACWPPSKDKHCKLTKTKAFYTHALCRRVGWVIFFFSPAEVWKCRLLQCITVFFSPSLFLMGKEERKMKSIFNVYRGAWLNSLHSAETILNKLIFNEQPLCMRAK